MKFILHLSEKRTSMMALALVEPARLSGGFWSYTNSCFTASTPQVLGLQTCTTCPASLDPFLTQFLEIKVEQERWGGSFLLIYLQSNLLFSSDFAWSWACIILDLNVLQLTEQ
jgi:hypothetical protein